MTNAVKLVECPRDSWQGLPQLIPAQAKSDYLRTLIAAGFQHIDAASFVSATAVPQMADSEEVLAMLGAPPDIELIGIVVNARGAERAIATGKVSTLGYPYSISPQFLQRNQHQSQQQSLAELKAIAKLSNGSGLGMVVYVSMAFGNPYGEAWSAASVMEACHLLQSIGVQQISLADTVGIATLDQVDDVVTQVLKAINDVEIGIHLHARPDGSAAKIAAAYRAGCRRFDTSIGGIGGCPFAQDALIGNIATEVAMAELARLGADLPNIAHLDAIRVAASDIAQNHGNTH